MIQQKSPPAGDSQLWLEMRRLENSWRAVSDIELAVLEAMIKKNAGDQAYATVMKGFPPQPWPCLPPAPCTRSIAEVRELVRMLGELCEQTIQGFQTMLADAEARGITEVTFRLTQSPSAPVGVDADMIHK